MARDYCLSGLPYHANSNITTVQHHRNIIHSLPWALLHSNKHVTLIGIAFYPRHLLLPMACTH